LTTLDRRWLDAAARLAMPHLGTTDDNPTVGAIVLDASGAVAGLAVTARGGRPHAETQALAMAGARARGGTLYVTLEPCNHWGRTPPCSDAVARAKIARVVIGLLDPDPRTAGSGVEKLRSKGVEVVVADQHEPSQRLHEGHILRKKQRRPFVTLKMAVSADGRIGFSDQGNVPITGEEAQRWTHMQRALSDAVLVGASTAMLDNPRLTVRLKGLEWRTPMRVILVGSKPLPKGIRLVEDLPIYPVGIIATRENATSVPPSVEQFRVDGTNGRPHIFAALRALGDRGIGRLLVEGGARLSEAMLALDLVDRFELLLSPREIGPRGVPATTVRPQIQQRLLAAGLTQVDQRGLGDDMLLTFERA